jgi:hypothetical protein
MYLVALTRWGTALEAELPTLAGWFGITAYDLRLRAAAGLPTVLMSTADFAAAAESTERLRARGHGAVNCDSQALGDSVVVREFNFGPVGLRGHDDERHPLDIAYSDIVGLIRALGVESADNSITVKEKKLNVGMAVMTGGLKTTKTVERTTRSASEAREQQLYLFTRARAAPWLFCEPSLRYQGLGARLKPTSIQNFLTLVEELRARAPHAHYDQRFLTQKRKVGIASAQGLAKERSVRSSNARENELAARLLVLAFEQAQL